MFDFFRSRKQFTRIVFGLLVLAFTASLIVFFVPQPGDLASGRNAPDTVASVDGTTITAEQFKTAYDNAIRFYSQQFKTQDRSIFKTLRFDRQILDRLVADRALEQEAQRMGVDATKQELIEKIQKLFSRDGKFIGQGDYLRWLQMNRMRPEEFEEDVRREIIREKMRHLIVDSVVVSPEEVKQEWLSKNQKASIEYVLFDPKEVEKQVAVTDAALEDYFNQNKDKYKTSEERKIKYILIDQAAIAKNVKISEQELRDYFQNNPGEEQVRVSHILFKVPEKATDEQTEAIRKKAEKVLAEVRKGGNFAELAKKYSEDRASAAKGGELPYSTRQTFVPEFAQVAFALNPGEVSDLVKTSYGFHIIKSLDKKISPFEERKSEIEITLRQKKAEDEAKKLADKVQSAWKRSKDADKTAKQFNLEVKQTPFFKQNDVSIPDLRRLMQLVRNSFTLPKPGDITSAVRVTGGYAVAQLEEIKPSAPAQFKDVRSKVEADYKKAKAEELATNKANEFLNAVNAEKDFDKGAKKFNVKVHTSKEFGHSDPIDDTLSNAPEVGQKAFAMKPGDVSDVVQANNKKVVFRLKSKSDFDKEKFEKEKDTVAQQLLSKKQDSFFQSYLNSIVDKMRKDKKIMVNEGLVKRLAA